MNDAKKHATHKTVAGIVLGAIGLGVVALGAKALFSNKPAPPKMVVQEVKIIRTEPPPPRPEEPPPPPEEVDVNEPEPEPEPTPSNEPPPGDLGLDAEGTAGTDGFGLAARPNGRDLVGSGVSQLTWYAGLVQSAILAELGNEKVVRSRAYNVPIRVWARADGSIERSELAQSTGDREVDRAIERAVARVTRIPYAAPAEMPQPITIRLVARI
jgi:periplasmic protein TonB